MERRVDLVMLLLYAKGPSGKLAEPIIGITRLTKLLFLLEKETSIENDFKFVAYKMGPYSAEINPVIEFVTSFPSPDSPLVIASQNNDDNSGASPEQTKYLGDIMSSDDSTQQLANQSNKTFQLTEKGLRVAEHVWNGQPEEAREAIEYIKKRYGKLSLRQLLKYVYTKYPDMTDNSEIKEYVLGE